MKRYRQNLARRGTTFRLERLEDRTTPVTFTVTNADDAGAGSLRDAIHQANGDGFDNFGTNDIVFAPAMAGQTINLTTVGNEEVGPSALLVGTVSFIHGSGQTITRGPGAPSMRLFYVTETGFSAGLTLEHLTLSNGLAQGGPGGGGGVSGGGGGAAGLGGAIYDKRGDFGSPVNLIDCTLTGNKAVGGFAVSGLRGGGGLDGPGEAITDPTMSAGGGNPHGGHIGGYAPGFGGGGASGWFVQTPGQPGDGGGGGGGGYGGGGGGGSSNKDFGAGGNGGFGGGGGGGVAAPQAGAAGYGAGAGGRTLGGGGGGGAGMGGAIFSQGATVTITDSTITGNAAIGGDSLGGGGGGGLGGGIFNYEGSVTLTNVTDVGNVVATGTGGGAAGPADGGAVYSMAISRPNGGASAHVTLANSILASAVGAHAATTVLVLYNGGLGSSGDEATITVTAPTLFSDAIGNDNGTIVGQNLILTGDAKLGPLADNGGPTRTLLPLAGSPALDAGDTAAVGDATTDQRGTGYARVGGPRVDLGAVEVQVSVPLTVGPATLPAGRVGFAYDITLTAAGARGPYTFAPADGAPALPGLTVAPGGLVVGFPTQAGPYHLLVRVTAADGQTAILDRTFAVTPLVVPDPVATTTTLVATPAADGQSLTLTATVTAATGTPVGTVTFASNVGEPQTATLAGGVASVTVPLPLTALLAGLVPSLTATYTPAAGFAPSASTEVRVALPPGLLTVALQAPDRATAGRPLALTATVTSPLVSPVPGGAVTFSADPTAGGPSVPLGVAPLVAGTATLTAPAGLPPGAYTVRAAFTVGDNLVLGTAAAGLTVSTSTLPPPPAPPPAPQPVQVAADLLALLGDLGTNPRVTTADLNGDGVADTIGASGPGSGNMLAVLDGKTRKLLARFAPYESTFSGGLYVIAGDLSGTGALSLIVSPDQGGGPVVAVYDAAKLAAGLTGDAAQVARFYGIADPNFRGGDRPAVGVFNGVPALIVAAGFGGGPRIAVYDARQVAAGSADPARLVPDFFAFEDTLRNGAYVAAGDLTGDGVADLVVGGGPGGGPRVRVIDGRSLLAAAAGRLDDLPATAQVANFFAGDPNSRDGVRVAVRDVFGDGRPALATQGGAGGVVHVYKAATLLAHPADPTPDRDLDPMNGAFVG